MHSALAVLSNSTSTTHTESSALARQYCACCGKISFTAKRIPRFFFLIPPLLQLGRGEVIRTSSDSARTPDGSRRASIADTSCLLLSIRASPETRCFAIYSSAARAFRMRWVRHRRVYWAVGRVRSWRAGCTVEAVEQAILMAARFYQCHAKFTSEDR
jgi:hypothetical protein